MQVQLLELERHPVPVLHQYCTEPGFQLFNIFADNMTIIAAREGTMAGAHTDLCSNLACCHSAQGLANKVVCWCRQRSRHAICQGAGVLQPRQRARH